MKINHIGTFKNARDFISDKLNKLSLSEKTFEGFFPLMFSERENVFAEYSNGYSISKITYGQCYEKIISFAGILQDLLKNSEYNSFVGMYMDNSVEWIEIFWALLMCGYRPVFLNSRLPDSIIEKVLSDYSIKNVISDGKEFSVATLKLSQITECKNEVKIANFHWANEIVFMSSGTSQNIKLCVYNGENLCNQLLQSADIICTSKNASAHYKGELKLLTLLPFYHIFGFCAVYVWFGFFSRTFVFLRDLRPETVLYTVKKHKVTHIMAVPLVWETIYKKTIKAIKSRGEKTYKKFVKALNFANNSNLAGNILKKNAFREIRENIFGDSIRFILSGGGPLQRHVLEFFNGIGYCFTTGYGMTETGIVSFERSKDRKVLNLSSIGQPLYGTELKISEKGELLIKGKTIASKILSDGKEQVTNFENWFNSHDLAKIEDGRYYITGRMDDMIVCENGENLNPDMIEQLFTQESIEHCCLISDNSNQPVMIFGVHNCYTSEKFRSLSDCISETLKNNNLSGAIKKVVFTTDNLLGENDFKVNRRAIAKRYNENKFLVLKFEKDGDFKDCLNFPEREISRCFAEVLQKKQEEIGREDNFFTDLGGSSLDYFNLVNIIKDKFGLKAEEIVNIKNVTVSELCALIEKGENELAK